jgi:hypothetical protein
MYAAIASDDMGYTAAKGRRKKVLVFIVGWNRPVKYRGHGQNYGISTTGSQSIRIYLLQNFVLDFDIQYRIVSNMENTRTEWTVERDRAH